MIPSGLLCLSNTIIDYHHRVLKSALNRAIKWQYIQKKPATMYNHHQEIRKKCLYGIMLIHIKVLKEEKRTTDRK
jgi:hypothetical protein